MKTQEQIKKEKYNWTKMFQEEHEIVCRDIECKECAKFEELLKKYE